MHVCCAKLRLVLVQAWLAQGTSVLISGAAGVGKSAVLHAIMASLSNQGLEVHLLSLGPNFEVGLCHPPAICQIWCRVWAQLQPDVPGPNHP